MNPITSLINSSTSWLRDQLSGLINYGFNTTISVIGSVQYSIQGSISSAFTNLTNFTAQQFAALPNVLDTALTPLESSVNSLAPYLQGVIVDQFDLAMAGFDAGNGWLFALYENLSEQFNVDLTAGFATLQWITEQSFSSLEGLVSAGTQGLQFALDAGFTNVETFFNSSIGELLEGLVVPFRTAGEELVAWGGDNFGKLIGFFRGMIAESIVDDLMADGLRLGGDIFGVLGDTVQTLIQTIFPTAPTKPEDAQDLVWTAWQSLLGVTLSVGGAVALAELVHPVKEAGFKYVSALLFDMAGFSGIGSAITMSFAEKAWIVPLRHGLNAVYQPEIPGPQDLIRFQVREAITPKEFNQTMLFHGFSEFWSGKYWDAHWVLPGISLSREMLYRGEISFEEYKQLLVLNDFDPRYVDKVANVAYRLPGVNDIIRFAVRETFIREETGAGLLLADMPSAFRDYMAQLGYDPNWADRFWDAHWELIPITRLYEAFYRKAIDRPRLEAELVKHDFLRADIDILLKTAYRQIPIIYLRRAWELGELSDPDLEYQLEIHGYDPEIVPALAAIVKRMALENEVSEVRRQWISLFERGWISRDTLKTEIENLKYKDEVVGYYLRKAELARERRLKDADLKLAIQIYRKEGYTDAQFRAKLMELGLQAEFVEDMVKIEKVRLERELEEFIWEW